MDSEEPCLVRCKQLPSPMSDRQNINSSMGQHLGIQCIQSYRGHVDQCSRESSQEASNISEENQDSVYQSDKELAVNVPECTTSESTQAKVAKLLNGKEKDWAVAAKNPLRLFDLPIDILKIIFKEVGRCMFRSGYNVLLTDIEGHSYQ